MKYNKPKVTIFFSPHSDDIALSIGGSIGLNKFHLPYTLVTIFGLTTFLGVHGIKNREEATIMRKAEDESFAQAINAKLFYFEFPDVLLRNDNNVEDVSTKSMITKDQILQIRNNCSIKIKKVNPELILIPAGIGNHFDHILLKDIIIDITKNMEISVNMYEDQPYTSFLGEKMVAKIISSTKKIMKNEVHLLKDFLSCKIDFVKKYESQLHDNKIEKIISYAYEIDPTYGGERIWIL